MIATTDELNKLLGMIEECIKDADHQIPSYAWADNAAACVLDESLREVHGKLMHLYDLIEGSVDNR